MTYGRTFVIEADAEDGTRIAQEWIARELKMTLERNPDISVFQYGLFSADDARQVCESAVQAPFVGNTRAIIITAQRVYHEAQNILLKIFEEPPDGTYFFLILLSLGDLLPTLRSRVNTLQVSNIKRKISKIAEDFLKADKKERAAIIKKLANGRDEEERRDNRDIAIAIINGIETAAYAAGIEKNKELLKDIQTLRRYLHDRSAPVRMIIEHMSFMLPKNLL